MAELLNETDLANYCLRKCGSPVIHINVDDTQVSDRIDDALRYFQIFHEEATQRTYVPIKVTGSTLQLTTNVAQTFSINETVTGSISGATFTLLDAPEINKLRSRKFKGTFIVGETVTGSVSGITGVIATNGIVIGNIESKYLTIPDTVVSIIRTVPMGSGKNASNYMFDAQYQFMASSVFNFTPSDLSYYVTLQQYLSLIDFTLNKQPSISFSRITGKLKFSDSFWDSISVDDYVMIEAQVSVVDGINTKVYDNFWVKKYAAALIKRQWGENLKKFGDMKLPGGITLNGKTIFDEAIVEQEELEGMMKDTFQAPLGMLIG